MLHFALFALLALLPMSVPEATLTVYTVRVLDAPQGLTPSSLRAASAAKAETRRETPVEDKSLDATAGSNGADASWETEEIGTVAREAPPAAKARPPSTPPADSRAAAPASAEPATPSSDTAGGAVSIVAAESLDSGFSLVAPIDLGYPEAARRARMPGRVRLEVEVGPDGRVLKVRVLESTQGWGFEESARSAYAQARFSPPRWQGRPVRVLWRKTLLFQP